MVRRPPHDGAALTVRRPVRRILQVTVIATLAGLVGYVVAPAVGSSAGQVGARPSSMAAGGGSLPAAESLDPPAALFIGDSYTAGAAGVPPQSAFACLTAAQMGWICNNGGEGGTGYASNGSEHGVKGQTYAERIPAYERTYLADYVLLSGARNDYRTPLDERVAAAKHVIDLVQAAYPTAQVVVIGPFWVGDEAPEELRVFNERLKADARRRRLPFIDTLSPPWLRTRDMETLISDDGVHPTAAGHGHLAARLVAALGAAGIRPSLQPTLGNPVTTRPAAAASGDR